MLAIAFNSCKKERCNDDKLEGSWKWERTDGGIANNIHETRHLQVKISTSRSVATTGILCTPMAYSVPRELIRW